MYLLLLSFLIAIPVSAESLGEESITVMNNESAVVIDFSDSSSGLWQPVNDVVMGGLSESQLSMSENGTAVFAGLVSLENNGGFASVRTPVNELDLSVYDGLIVRVLGDGKRYRLRLRTDKRFDGVAYQATFNTHGKDWQVVEIPFASFIPTYRGRTVPGAPPLNIAKISQIAFMIADKQEGRFRLEIAWIRAFSSPSMGDGD